MIWSESDKLAYLVRLPWTIVPQEGDDPGDLVVTCAEIPAAIGTGSNERELERSFWEALRVALRSHLREGDPIPLPRRVRQTLPWERDAGTVTPVAGRVVMTPGARTMAEPSSGALTGGIDTGESELVQRNMALA